MKNSREKFESMIIDYFMEIEDFISKSDNSRMNSNEKYKIAESKIELLTDFRTLLDGLILNVSKNFHTPVKELNENISYQIGICASFLRTHFLINKLIMGGDIIEATTLIRKQLEAATRFSELETKEIQKLTKRTPNVNNESKGVTKDLYSKLSEIAHSGSLDVTLLIARIDSNENISTANIFPFFSKDSLECYKFHAYVAMIFLGKYINFARKLYPEHDPISEIKMFLVLDEIHKDIPFLNNKE